MEKEAVEMPPIVVIRSHSKRIASAPFIGDLARLALVQSSRGPATAPPKKNGPAHAEWDRANGKNLMLSCLAGNLR